jgi:hypothetical protein
MNTTNEARKWEMEKMKQLNNNNNNNNNNKSQSNASHRSAKKNCAFERADNFFHYRKFL